MNALKYFGLVTSIAIASVAQPVDAQVAKPPANGGFAIPAGHSTRYIRVRNVPPSLMAWWLQPERHPEPMAFAQSRQNAHRFFGKVETKSQPMFPVPIGLTAIVPIDPQNALLAIGTEDAIAEVEKFVTALDRPLRQVEVEAQLIEFEHADDMKALGIGLTGGGAQMVVKRPQREFRAELSRLVEAKRAKVLNSPRVTAINNLTAALWSATGNPAVAVPDVEGSVSILPAQAKGSSAETKPSTATSKTSLELADTLGVAVTPTINNDDTITLVLQVGRTVRLQDRQSGDSVSLYSPSSIQTVARVRDGDTIVLGGLTTQVVPAQSTSSAVNPGTTQAPQPEIPPTKTVVVLVTARIIRRLDEFAGRPVVPVPNEEWREAMRREAMRREAAIRGIMEKAAP